MQLLFDEGKLTQIDLEMLQQAAKYGDKIAEHAIYFKLEKRLDDLKTDISVKSRTAKLWLQYMEYIDVMKQYICAATY